VNIYARLNSIVELEIIGKSKSTMTVVLY